MKNYSKLQLGLSFLGGLALLFIVGPLLALFFDTDLKPLIQTVEDEKVLHSIWLTLWVSLASTLFFSFLAIPLAYILAKRKFKGRRLINGLVDLPIVIPHTAAGIAILGCVSRDSFFGGLANKIGLNFVGNPMGIGLAMAFVSVPFLINAARDGFAAVPNRIEKAALNLGASEWQTFYKISIPLASRNITTGLVMMFARGLSEFGAVIIIAYNPMISPILIYERFTSYGLAYARPAALVFILVVLAFFIVLKSITNRKNQIY